MFSYEQFKFCLNEFERTSRFQDTWTVRHTSNNESFLQRERTTLNVIDKEPRLISWDYQVIYSHSYATPVFYFNGCLENGKLLSLENIELFLQPAFRQNFTSNKWKYLSQQEHPFLRQPFYYFHPCHTEEVFKHLPEVPKVNPLITWLSIINSLIDLNLRPEYGLEEFDGKTFDVLRQN